MNKNQVKGIAAGIGYFALYACLMMIFQTVYTFVLMGAVFALIFAKTNSLPVCIIAHAAANIPDMMTYLMR